MQKMFFYQNKFYKNNQAQICSEIFQYPKKYFWRRTDIALLNSSLNILSGVEENLIFQ